MSGVATEAPFTWQTRDDESDGRRHHRPRYRYDALIPVFGAVHAGPLAGRAWQDEIPDAAIDALEEDVATVRGKRRRRTDSDVLANARATFASAPRCLDSDPACEAWLYAHDPRLWPMSQRAHDERADAHRLTPTSCIVCRRRSLDLWWITATTLVEHVGYDGRGHSGPIGWLNVAGVICSECADGADLPPQARVLPGSRHVVDPVIDDDDDLADAQDDQ